MLFFYFEVCFSVTAVDMDNEKEYNYLEYECSVVPLALYSCRADGRTYWPSKKSIKEKKT